MNEIKFRAWVKEYEVMCKVDGLDWYVKQVAVDESERGLVTEFKWDEVELMQYTGLKDKNGVEIYEGDILEVEKNEDGTYKGTINGNTFFGRFQGYSSKVKVDGVHDINNIRYWNNHVEVIGNIYENPELLEEF